MTHGRWKSSRRALAALVAGSALLIPLAGSALASDNPDGHDPSQWPTAPGVNPSTDGLANGIRFMGTDRYQTNFATQLSQHECGNQPFDTSDRTNGTDSTDLGDAETWGACGSEYAILVTAGDKFPDSLTAASMSEAGDNGNRVTAKSLNDGDVNLIDTEDAPIILTRSTREGATGLSPSASRAARDAIDNDSAESAIIVGGTAAVPTGAESELQSMGYDVYRIGGVDRFDTAKQIAFSGNNADPGTTTCDDPDSRDGADMAFYQNGTVELRPTNNTCKVLGRTVFLADGLTGADALAVSWVSSFSGAPTLLTSDVGLPAPTQSALQTLNIDNIVAVGGTARISDATLAQAATLAGVPTANTYRVAGIDRSATSVEIAKLLGGWYAQTDTDATNSIFTLASSGGQGDAGTGWPDALGAGPWSAVAHGYNDDPHPPFRASAPANGDDPFEGNNGHPGFDAVPILLTPTGSATLPSSIDTFLKGMFPQNQDWCDSTNGSTCDADPGFVVAFGGTAAIPQGAFEQANTLVSGGQYTSFGDTTPAVGAGFWTRLDMSPLFVNGNTGGINHTCYSPDALTDVRWLSVYNNAAKTSFDTEYDVMLDAGTYDVDTGDSGPVCVAGYSDAVDSISHVFGDSISGHFTAGVTYDYSGDNRLELSQPHAAAAPAAAAGTSSGDPGSDGPPDTGGTTTTLTWTEPTGVYGTAHLPIGGTSGTDCVVTSTSLTLTITRDVDNTEPADDVTGSFTVTTSCGTVTGNVIAGGVAANLGGSANADVWIIRGATLITGGTAGVTGGLGGFTATWTTADDANNLNDGISWQADALES